MSTTVFNPRAEFVKAVREIIDAMSHDKVSTCPFCQCEPSWQHEESCPLRRLNFLMERYALHFPESVEPRREKTLTIPRDRLLWALDGESNLKIYCTGLPEDARLAGIDREIAEDFVTNYPIRLIIESASFPPVLPHERPAMHEVLWHVYPVTKEGD